MQDKRMRIPQRWTFKNKEVANAFDRHVREQLPWYELATASVEIVARHYLPKHGLVYDLGAATGNIGRALEPLLRERQARLIAVEESREMASIYRAPGMVQVRSITDMAKGGFNNFDVGIAFLTLMFLSVTDRQKVLERMRSAVQPGGVIIIVDKISPPGGYAGQVVRRMTLHWKRRNGATPDEIIEKELALAGIQRPLDPAELGDGAVEFFRLGEFAGWLIERGAV